MYVVRVGYPLAPIVWPYFRGQTLEEMSSHVEAHQLVDYVYHHTPEPAQAEGRTVLSARTADPRGGTLQGQQGGVSGRRLTSHG